MRQRFVTAVGKFSVFLGKACGPFYIAAIALSVWEVFTRYALDTPTVWTTEVVMALCATAWMISAAAVTQQHRHITVTVMEIVVGHKTWMRMRRVAMAVSLLAVVGLLWANWQPFLRATAHLERSGSAFNPPLPTYLKVMIVFALITYALQILANLLDRKRQTHDHGTGHMDLTVDMKD
ncbi:TRAP transporter small permease subunit [Marinovum algicola]|jgi:TRAP-type C4-dicarboxylate transport system permease small subunit|uniref:TRAP transporter small permease subunit n=1 Tax=Marinovum algicola TaxID=42444 RepID=UPI0024BAF0F7|nr:TRAP transporter small permease [Marinovum algicola]